jgi:hypothetical protein
MIESGKNYSRLKASLCPLMYSYYEVEYLGIVPIKLLDENMGSQT